MDTDPLVAWFLWWCRTAVAPSLAEVHPAYRPRVDAVVAAESLAEVARGLNGLPHHDLDDATEALVRPASSLAAALASGHANYAMAWGVVWGAWTEGVVDSGTVLAALDRLPTVGHTRRVAPVDAPQGGEEG